MMIQTAYHAYRIIYKKKEQDSFSIYVCQSDIPEIKDEYTLLVFRKKEDICQILTLNLLQKEITNHLIDFVESFVWKESFVMVFVRKSGIPLKEWMQKKEPVFSERLEMAKRILERFLLLNLPEYLLAAILQDTCIFITKSEEVVFRYEPESFLLSDKDVSECIRKGFEELFAFLFQRELEAKMSDELLDFMDAVKKEEYQDVFYLYQKFHAMRERLLGQEAVDSWIPMGRMQSLRRRVEKWMNICKRLLPLLLVTAAMILLLYWISHPEQEEAPEHTIEKIGTLYIR